jgi:hypothetical protein
MPRDKARAVIYAALPEQDAERANQKERKKERKKARFFIPAPPNWFY